jgi:hypothetical protein
MDRPTVSLVFGAGLDRESGILSADPQSFADLRNVEVRQGKVAVRKGLELATDLSLDGLGVTPMTDVALVQAFRARQLGVLVAYEAASRKVQVFTAASSGVNPTFQLQWGVLDVDAGRPLFFGAESYRKVFLAHAMESLDKRLKTVWFDPDDTPVLQDLSADLDGAGSADIFFRGVAKHLNYLMGWGYGTASDADRPEIVRTSLPGQPHVFNREHYFIVGTRGEPVVNGMTLTRDGFLVAKENELFLITGTNRSNFGWVGIDPSYGFAGARLGAVLNGVCYFWSSEGPRATSGGPSEDLAIPLDLAGPQPDDLVELGPIGEGFAQYKPDTKQIEFIFGHRAYVLNLRIPSQPRWTYKEYGEELRCGGLFYVGSTSAVPEGFPENVVLTATASTLLVAWDNEDAVGDEQVEIWLQVGSGTWTRVRSLTVDGDSQTETLTDDDGVIPATLHTVALRFRRGLLYTDDYNDVSNPGSWPATSVDDATTDAGALPPSSFALESSQVSTVGSKQYQALRFDIVPTESSPSTTEILEATVDNVDLASVVWSGSADLTQSEYFGSYLIQATASYRYFWIRHALPDGTPSDPVELAANPVNVSVAVLL